MICIFFVPGMFGSTIEHVLTSFTNELSGEESIIRPDGSMHTFRKQKHLTTKRNFVKFFVRSDNSYAVTTPIYPLKDAHLLEMLDLFSKYSNPTDRSILVYADTFEAAEINMLFMYYKIAISPTYHGGMDLFYSSGNENFSQWNSSYTNWKQMKSWELREWLSLFYPNWVQEWIDSQHQVGDDFLKVSSTSILEDTEQTLTLIIEHCGLTRNSKNLAAFVKKWQEAQQYIRQEYLLIHHIIYCIMNSIDFSWNKLNIVAEAILQQRLRSNGFEIRCDGLNDLPTNSVEFFKFLIAA
jgi:hypothetical protein